MIDVDNMKHVLMLYPQLKDNGDFANNTYVDTLGWTHLRVLFMVGVTDIGVGSTAEGTPPLLEECDTSGGSYSDVTSAALAAVIAATDDGLIKAIDVDLSKTHKRYIQVQAPHSGDGSVGANLAILGILSRTDGNGPANAAGMGLDELIKA